MCHFWGTFHTDREAKTAHRVGSRRTDRRIQAPEGLASQRMAQSHQPAGGIGQDGEQPLIRNKAMNMAPSASAGGLLFYILNSI